VMGRSSPSHGASREKPRGADPELSPDLRGDTGPDSCDQGRASQFVPAIDKERKLISNLRWSMSMFVHTVSNIRPSGQHDKAIDQRVDIQHVHDVMYAKQAYRQLLFT
jgi:hypothetical protein